MNTIRDIFSSKCFEQNKKGFKAISVVYLEFMFQLDSCYLVTFGYIFDGCMRKVSQSFVLQFKKRWHLKYMLKTFVWRQLLTWIAHILYAPYYLVDNNTTILFKICICWTKRGKNINYFQCYDIEWVSTLFLFARWDQRMFFRIKHAYICICISEKVPPSIVLITLLIIKGKDLNWLLASCKDTAIKRFFHKQASSKAGRQAGSQPGQTKRTWTLNI